ncbi:MAG: dihydroneopterin triphosphate diphosphatase [Chloroflexota bacterium]|nr:dihydroneopterin triphosphate diphosphatase [Chloroflexota bacterium]
MFRPDLVDVWIYRDVADGPEILLLRRVPGRVLPGLWQGVSGSLEGHERVVDGALRELREETAFEPPVVEAFFDLDLVNQFHFAAVDAVMTAAVFAARVRGGVEPVLSHEHDATRWLPLDVAMAEVNGPADRAALRRIGENLLDPARARWFELAPDGLNVIR